MIDSPNLESLDAWAYETRRVEKPWGYELIWALTDVYCGKVLFVREGQSLSLQFHREKDESWLIQSGRAKQRRQGLDKRQSERKNQRHLPDLCYHGPDFTPRPRHAM